MGAFVPPPPKELVEAYINEINGNIEEMDGTIVQLNQMLAASQARLHGLLCSKSILENWLGEQPEQLELPFPEPDNIVRFEHGSN